MGTCLPVSVPTLSEPAHLFQKQLLKKYSNMHRATLSWFTFLIAISFTFGNKEANKIEESDKKLVLDDAVNDKIERYLKLLEKKRDAIDKFLVENYSDFNHSDYTPEEYVSHPINAYMLMKRTSVMWQMAKPDILDTSSDDLWKEIEKDLKNLQKQEL